MNNTLETQQGDVDLFQTLNDGEIFIEGGLVAMSGGLESAVFLSLYGGNEDDTGRDNDPFTWWGNLLESNPSNMYRSETQNLLQSLPLTSANLLRVEDAARRDLQWLLDESVASSVEVIASIPALNRICIEININALGEQSQFRFVDNWFNQPIARTPFIPVTTGFDFADGAGFDFADGTGFDFGHNTG